MNDLAAGPIAGLLDSAAGHSPQAVAIRTPGGDLSYGDLSHRTSSASAWLAHRGVRRGDRVVLVLPNGAELVSLLLGCARLGAMFCIVSQQIRPHHLQHILVDAEPRLVISTAKFVRDRGLADLSGLSILEEFWEELCHMAPLREPPPVISLDPAALIYTSGSTAHPKAVISTHANILFATSAIQQCLRLRSDDVIANLLPFSFDYGLYQLFLAMQSMATLALGTCAQAGPGMLEALCEWKATVFPIVPSLGRSACKLARRAHRLPPIRMITNTGENLDEGSVGHLKQCFPGAQVFLMFGLTECKRVSILDPEDYAARPASVGRPLPDTECFIVDDEGKVLGPDTAGELVVRGPHVMRGYWKDDAQTNRRYRVWGHHFERMLFTGDLCHMDRDGYLYFHGRADDIYKQSGFRVSGLEVETAARMVPGVEAASLLLPQEETDAILVYVGDASTAEVVAGLQELIENYKLPRQVIAVQNFPLSPNGKIDKGELRRIVETTLERGE